MLGLPHAALQPFQGHLVLALGDEQGGQFQVARGLLGSQFDNPFIDVHGPVALIGGLVGQRQPIERAFGIRMTCHQGAQDRQRLLVAVLLKQPLGCLHLERLVVRIQPRRFLIMPQRAGRILVELIKLCRAIFRQGLRAAQPIGAQRRPDSSSRRVGK